MSLSTSCSSQQTREADTVPQRILWLSNTQGPRPWPHCKDPFAPSFKHSCMVGCHHHTNGMHELLWKFLEVECPYFVLPSSNSGRMAESPRDAQLLLCHGAQLGSEPLEQSVCTARTALSASFY